MTFDLEKGFARFNPVILSVEDSKHASRLLEELGCDSVGASIMKGKMNHFAISVENLSARAANIIKQVMLSKGGECATPRNTITGEEDPSRIIVIGTRSQISEAAKNLSLQPFNLKELSEVLKELLRRGSQHSVRKEIRCADHTLIIGERTLIMGVLNVTPDSFSDGGRFLETTQAFEYASKMKEWGADIIDVGGESTRPGSAPVALGEEMRRTIPVVERIRSELDIPVSIDTTKAEVARRAIDAGASIINDISALGFDGRMIDVARDTGAAVIIMHMQGTPRDMQENPIYEDVVLDVSRFLRERVSIAVGKGIEPGRIIVDPGIGFGKNLEHNLEIIRRIDEFRSLGYPIAIGPSRKRFIGEITGRAVDERVFGTAASVAFVISRGVDIVRVHDVREMVDVVRVADALQRRSI
ncbi:MAG: dihydropteroate synthase [Actinomycetota bacterium]|nr:dihydropteroate synthase [Actinomycetota bacterium]